MYNMTKNVHTIRKAFSTLDISRVAADPVIFDYETRRSAAQQQQEDVIPMRDQLRAQAQAQSASSFIPRPLPPKSPAPETTPKRTSTDPKAYCKPFCDFLTENPTVFHAVSAIASDYELAGFTKLSERDSWKLKKGGKYFVERNGSSLIAFEVGADYEPGNGVAMLAGHVDALTAKLKPIPKVRSKAGYQMLGVAPYAGALNSTWWDRDLGVGGRVLVKESSGKIVTKLVKLDWPSMSIHKGSWRSIC